MMRLMNNWVPSSSSGVTLRVRLSILGSCLLLPLLLLLRLLPPLRRLRLLHLLRLPR